MARGDHPERTAFYGVCLLAGAFLALWLATSVPIRWLSITIGVLAVLATGAGFLMTFRDLG
ncbi:hypothetical protein [Mycolicibacterium komossense]|uniref:UsfY protein n=1 Tax=Mycolicibacterium komossense TaxID=1779 RepID=A0ABT3C5J7_9MYCO|nr:hypothetical protein [Mycolicibacterium komossense]MCV7224738.1 hypothetical protein [Mycolicibacterium komossense]